MDKFRLSPEAHIGRVTLAVSDLPRALEFYAGLLGFQIVDQGPSQAKLSASGTAPIHLVLDEIPNAIPQPHGTTGLFHTAIRLPVRAELGRVLARLINSRWPLQGFADHLVSEAIYLGDPDGLGVELYADRPEDSWPRMNGMVQMATDPLDLESLLAAGEKLGPNWEGIHPATDIGHVHLRVSNLNRSGQFYAQEVGMDITQESYPGALFLSAGGYHHHVGLNIWGSRGGSPPPSNAVGLRAFSILLPDERALNILEGHLADQIIEEDGSGIQEAGPQVLVRDPDGISLVLEIPG